MVSRAGANSMPLDAALTCAKRIFDAGTDEPSLV